MKTQQKIFMNRELSWLKFNERVLEEAENREVPLCERLTFASIYQSNLDEFFMVRVGSLIDQMLLDKNMKENKTKMTPQEQIDAIIPQVQKLNRRKDSVYEEMMDSLKEHNIHLVNFQKISKKESEYLRAYFQAEIAPLISPTIIGKRQPFPFLKNKEIYAVAVLETKNRKEKLGIIPCGNETFDRLINISGKDAYMLSEEMILHYVPRIFKGYHVKAKTLIRITRNADIDADALYKKMYLNDAIVIVSSTADGELSEELSEAVSGKNAGIVVVSCSEDAYMKGDFADCGDSIFYTDISPTKARIMLALLLDNNSDSDTFKNAFTRRRV